jgi:hypothetical protein
VAIVVPVVIVVVVHATSVAFAIKVLAPLLRLVAVIAMFPLRLAKSFFGLANFLLTLIVVIVRESRKRACDHKRHAKNCDCGYSLELHGSLLESCVPATEE